MDLLMAFVQALKLNYIHRIELKSIKETMKIENAIFLIYWIFSSIEFDTKSGYLISMIQQCNVQK